MTEGYQGNKSYVKNLSKPHNFPVTLEFGSVNTEMRGCLCLPGNILSAASSEPAVQCLCTVLGQDIDQGAAGQEFSIICFCDPGATLKEGGAFQSALCYLWASPFLHVLNWTGIGLFRLIKTTGTRLGTNLFCLATGQGFALQLSAHDEN